jgi:hypothetical protein
MNPQTCHHLIPDNGIEYVIAGEKELSAARKWASNYAERHAVLRLIKTAEEILDSMSVIDQPAMHARLRSDLGALNEYSLESKS